MEVKIFPESVPLRKRSRQVYTFTFNDFTLGSIAGNEINKIETVSIRSQEIGVTLRKVDGIYHTVFGLPTASQINPYILDLEGQNLYKNSYQSAIRDHQSFTMEGSLFSSSFVSMDEWNDFLEDLSLSLDANPGGQTTSSSNGSIWLTLRSITPEPSTVLEKEDFSSFGEYATGSIGEKAFKKVAYFDSDFFESNINADGIFEQGGIGNGGGGTYRFLRDSDISPGLWESNAGSGSNDSESREEAILSSNVGYIGINKVFTSNIIETLKSAGINTVNSQRGNYFKQNSSIYEYSPSIEGINLKGQIYGVPPGIHATFKKITPIFPGEDFTIKFKNKAKNNPISSPTSSNGEVPKFLLRKKYLCIDSGLNLFSESFGNIPENYAVCPFTFNKNKNTNEFESTPCIDSKTASNYYLAHQPYVIVEIDGGFENRFYLMIPYNGDVLFIEETTGLSLYSYLNEDGKMSSFFEKPPSDRPVSKVVYNFRRKGSSLLNLDYFSIHFQHYRGSLKISFSDSMDSGHVITRMRTGNNFLSSLSGDSHPPEELNKSEFRDEISKSEKMPIKLNGTVRVHMGNIKTSFNFSPISYLNSSTLKIENPVGILGLDGNENAVNILLRSSGEYGESENTSRSFFAKDIKSESGKVIPAQYGSFYTHNATFITEVVNGISETVGIEDLPLIHRQMTTGPNSKDNPNPEVGYLSSGSSVLAGFSMSNDGDFTNRIYPVISISSGDFEFRSIDGNYSWTLFGAVRPICDGFTVFIPEGLDTAWEPVSADVTVNVMSFTDTWTRANRTFLQHSGNIKFYLNKSDALPILESLSVVDTDRGELFGDIRTNEKFNTRGAIAYGESIGDMSAFLASLQDKYFYIQIKAWRDPVKTQTYGVGLSNNYSRYSSNKNSFFGTHQNKFPNDDNTIIFTGLCNKSIFNVTDSRVEMNCTLNDYWEIFDQLRWLNPPFYDAMRDYNAVMDITQRAGFFYENGSSSPGYLIKKYVDTPSNGDYYEISYDGYKVLANDYVLPGSYGTLNSPMLRPVSGQSTYGDFLKKIANISGKVIYFDRKGVLHFDVPEDELEIYQVEGASPGKPLYKAVPFDIFSFTYSVVDNKQVNWWNVILGGYSFERVVQDIVNEIRVVSSTPEGSLVSFSHMNEPSIYDIDLPGFIGFRKTFLQRSGYFGSGKAAEKMVNRYTTMFNAPIRAKFEILGRVGLQANQTILVDGPGTSGPYRLLLTNVSNKIDPKKNDWTATVEGRYFLPGEKVDFKKYKFALSVGNTST